MIYMPRNFVILVSQLIQKTTKDENKYFRLAD